MTLGTRIEMIGPMPGNTRSGPHLASGQNCSDCLRDCVQPASEVLSGLLSTEAQHGSVRPIRKGCALPSSSGPCDRGVRPAANNPAACRRAAETKRCQRSAHVPVNRGRLSGGLAAAEGRVGGASAEQRRGAAHRSQHRRWRASLRSRS